MTIENASFKGATQFLQGNNPELFDDVYPTTIDPQRTGLSGPYQRVGWQDKLGAAFNQNSPLINWSDSDKLEAARRAKDDIEVPDSILTDGIPKEFQAVVLDEKYKHGGVAALTLRDQLIEDVQNKTIMDNLEWYEQLGYTAAGFLADPTTYVAAGGAMKVGSAVASTARRASLLTGSKLPRTAAKLTQWGATGGVESAVLNAPKLAGDHTYTIEDYHADIVVDMLLGAGLTYSGSKLLNKVGNMDLQRANRESAVVEQVKMMDAELGGKPPETDIDVAYAVRRVLNPNVATRERTNIRNLEQSLGVYTPTNIEAEFPQLMRGALADKIDEAVRVATKDNDTAWMLAKVKQLDSQGRLKGDHPAFRAPTKANLADLINTVQSTSSKIDSKLSDFEPVEIVAAIQKVAASAARKASDDSRAAFDSSKLSYGDKWSGVTKYSSNEVPKGVEADKGYMVRAMQNDEVPESVIEQQKKELTEIQKDAELAVDLESPEGQQSIASRLLRQSHDKLTATVSDYHQSGEHKIYADILKPSTLGQTAARAVSQWGGITQDLATRFIESGSPTLNWVGTHLTEMGRGYGGDVMRKHTAGVIREAEYIKSISQIMPDYDKAVKAYAASKGSKAVGQMMAATSVGGRNRLQDEFAKEFMRYMNNTRRGRQVDNPLMAEFAQKWNAYMRHNYKQLEKNNIAGFTGENQRSNYVPQVWNMKHAQRMLRTEPDKVRTLLTKATGDEDKAEHLIEWFQKQDVESYDGYVATNDSRALERMEVDWDVEADGLSILDLLETDTRKLATSYSNRVAGWVGVSKATNGKITSYTDLNALKTMVWQETGKAKDVETVTDVIDLLFGRPVQGGLPDYARSIKAATVLTRLGSLGSAQLIESGTVATRAVMESVGNPKFMKKLTKGLSPKETAQDLMEIQKLTGNDWDYHLINTEAEYWTEYDLANTSKLQNQVDWAVDKATFGSAKQVAGRAFGHVTGYNQVRRYQAAMMQRSFAMQVARKFKHGSSKMSNERMADYGLTDVDGNNPELANAINTHVEFDTDGYPSKYNFDKWSDEARDSFMYGLQRAEATELMRPLIGEMPEWFNKPWVQMLMQFRSMPLVAQNKALGRSLAFADKEAVTQLVLNIMTSALVRYGKFAGLAALATVGGESFEKEYQKKLDNAGQDSILGGAVDRYVTQGGLYSDVYALSLIGGSANNPQQYLEKAMGQIPAMGLVKDYAMAAYNVSEGEGDKALNNAMRIVPLGNTLAFEAAATVVEESLD